MHWLYIILAGILEVAWALGLKYSDGFSKLYPSIFTVILMILSFVVLAQGMKALPVGTAYAVWTGIGAVGTAIFGIIIFKEPITIERIACLSLIIVGIMGLKYFEAS